MYRYGKQCVAMATEIGCVVMATVRGRYEKHGYAKGIVRTDSVV